MIHGRKFQAHSNPYLRLRAIKVYHQVAITPSNFASLPYPFNWNAYFVCGQNGSDGSEGFLVTKKNANHVNLDTKCNYLSPQKDIDPLCLLHKE